MSTNNDPISLAEIRLAKEQIKSAVLVPYGRFFLKAMSGSVAVTIGSLLVMYFLRPGTPTWMYYFISAIWLGFGFISVLIVGAWMAKRYFWYSRELNSLEKRVLAGESVPRPERMQDTGTATIGKKES